MRKPANIVFGVDERPYPDVLLASALQHVGILAIFLVFPVVIARTAHLPEDRILDLVSFSLLAMGIGAVLPALNRGPVGSGYVSPSQFSSAYVVPSLVAVKTGGLALVFGMTIFSGFIGVLFGRVQHRLRPFFPPEIAGLVGILLAISCGKLGAQYVLGGDVAARPGTAHLLIAAGTLAVMVGLSVWAKGRPKMFSALAGMVVGYAAAAAAGLLSPANVERIIAAPMVAAPSAAHIGWAFDAAFALPFIVAALATGLGTVGVVATCQRINDAEWLTPDMKNIGKGVVANGVVSLAAGLLGTVGFSASSSAVGLASATGVTSRIVAFAIGGLCFVLAFLPKAAAIVAVMPAPVIGAVLLFSAAFILLNGIDIVASRLLDTRRTFVVGLSFAIGLAADFYPDRFGGVPAAIAPLFSSSLVLGLLCALTLNLMFRVGAWRTGKLRIDKAQIDSGRVMEFIESMGASWGARRDMIERIRFNLAQSVETIAGSAAATGPLDVEASFDGYRVDIRVHYDGAPLALPETRPTDEEILETDDGHHRLAGYLLRQLADRVRTVHRGGRTSLVFQFDH